MKAANNRTLAVSDAEAETLLARCLHPAGPLTEAECEDRILPGDCLALLPLLPRGSADLLIADPPYNLSKDYHGGAFRRMSDEDYAAYTERWLDLALPILKPDASVYVCCDWRSGLVLGPILEKRLKLRSRITWQREKGRGAQRNWKNALEDVWFATVSDEYCFHPERVRLRRRVLAPYRKDGAPKDWEETEQGRFRDTAPSNFWDDVTVPFWSMRENTPHPTQKSEKLMAKLILASSEPGDLILDPFLGSGSSAVTAKKLGRRFVGIEQNERYCAWALKRLELAGESPGIQGYADGVFWERNTAAILKKR
ncbi:MAG: site-specific DNA-methyltransferase [Oscillospiraceae bacterium]|nr:site-specific DNA-methyltransferase [Oscillospiraceae bacterium]